MKPLATAQSIMIWFSFCSAKDFTSIWKKIASFVLFLLILIPNVCLATSSLVYVSKYLSIDLNGSVFAFMIVANHYTWVYFTIIAFFMRHKINGIFELLTTIYRTSKCPNIEAYFNGFRSFHLHLLSSIEFFLNLDERNHSFELLVRVNDTCERIWKFHFKGCIIGFVGSVTSTSIISVVHCWIANGYLDTTEFYYPLKIVYDFFVKNLNYVFAPKHSV